MIARRARAFGCALGLLGAALAGFSATALAMEGDHDTSFGSSGVTDYGNNGHPVGGLAIDAEGRIVVGGGDYHGFALARYLPDGTRDLTFGGDGTVATQIGPNGEFNKVQSIAIDSSDRIVAGGFASDGAGGTNFALARYLPGGSLDTSFSGDGKILLPFGSGNDEIRSVVIDSLDRIVVAGRAWNGSNYDFALARFLPDGTLDPSFHGDGMLTLSFGSENEPSYNPGEGAASVAIDALGRIVAAGTADTGAHYEFAAARLLSDGSPDPSFSGDGKVTTAVGSWDFANAVAIDSQGRILLGGQSGNQFGLVRYLPDGSLDDSFDEDGIVTTAYGNQISAITSLGLDSRGRIVASGYYDFDDEGTGLSQDITLFRYLPDGSPDKSFGLGNGRVLGSGYLSGCGTDSAGTMAIDAQDRIFVGGFGCVNDFPVGRFIGDETTRIVSGPPDGSATAETTPAFGFSSSIPGSSFECRVDEGSWASCVSPQAPGPLSEGSHAFAVRSTDPEEVTDPTPALSTFTVDTSPPETTIDSVHDGSPATVSFSSSEPDSTFQCRSADDRPWTDDERWFRCYGGESSNNSFPGSYAFEVRSIDRAGNVDPTPAAATLTVIPVPGACTNRESGRGEADVLIGSSGGDLLHGAGGNDVLDGRLGADCLFGDGDNDVVRGGRGDDTISGGSGFDVIYGGPGRDMIDGGSEGDRIHARDGQRDEIRCGVGRDRVWADRRDQVTRDCERVMRP